RTLVTSSLAAVRQNIQASLMFCSHLAQTVSTHHSVKGGLVLCKHQRIDTIKTVYRTAIFSFPSFLWLFCTFVCGCSLPSICFDRVLQAFCRLFAGVLQAFCRGIAGCKMVAKWLQMVANGCRMIGGGEHEGVGGGCAAHGGS
ncbi:MAG: hypothetical protein ACI3YC_01085, partial [Alloprevotella sp.]